MLKAKGKKCRTENSTKLFMTIRSWGYAVTRLWSTCQHVNMSYSYCWQGQTFTYLWKRLLLINLLNLFKYCFSNVCQLKQTRTSCITAENYVARVVPSCFPTKMEPQPVSKFQWMALGKLSLNRSHSHLDLDPDSKDANTSGDNEVCSNNCNCVRQQGYILDDIPTAISRIIPEAHFMSSLTHRICRIRQVVWFV